MKSAAGLHAADEHLLAMAGEQFDRVNTFNMSASIPSQLVASARDIRHLQVDYKLMCEGGELYLSTGQPRFPIFHADVAKVRALPTLFPRLLRLDIRVDNTGRMAPGIQ